MADTDLDTASRDCLSWSDTDDVSIWTACKKYRKSSKSASCKLSKGSDWMETQMKRIRDSHQNIWGHDHKIVRIRAEMHSSRGLHFLWNENDMMTRTDSAALYSWSYRLQSLYQGSQRLGLSGPVKALVLSLKQFHAHFYRLYEKGTIRGNGCPPRPTLQQWIPASKHLSKHGP